MERNKKTLLDPEKEKRAQELDELIAQLKAEIDKSKKDREQLEQELNE